MGWVECGVLIFEEYEGAFRSRANPLEAPAMAAYMKNHFDFLGLKTPERREILKPYLVELRAEARAGQGPDTGFVERNWVLGEREFHYNACDYLALPAVKGLLGPEHIPWLRSLVERNTWWDTVDRLDRIIGDVALRYPELDALMLAWARDENFWVRRVAIDHQLPRKQETRTDLLEEIILLNLGSREFFINKAIGWSLREYAKTNPAWVLDFLDRHGQRLAPLSLREATKHLRSQAPA